MPGILLSATWLPAPAFHRLVLTRVLSRYIVMPHDRTCETQGGTGLFRNEIARGLRGHHRGPRRGSDFGPMPGSGPRHGPGAAGDPENRPFGFRGWFAGEGRGRAGMRRGEIRPLIL